MNTHPDLASAYRAGLRDLLSDGLPVPSVQDPRSPASGFGAGDRPSIELIGYSFEVANPAACLVDSEARPLRLPYCVGSLLWTLAGSNDLEHLQAYHPAARNFSDDGISLSGAFGRRLFRYDDRIDQIDAIVGRLQADPSSRRTFAAICDAEDNVRDTREYPCCIGVQYFLRDGALHTITFMRAQHALLILPYDAFLFMSIQRIVAARLGVRIGSYRHVSGTFHLYESELTFARRVLDEPVHSLELGAPDGTWSELPDVLRFEEEARSLGSRGEHGRLLGMVEAAAVGSGFATQTKLVTLAHWLDTVAPEATNPALDALPSSMQEMMRRQWRNVAQMTR